VIGDRKREKKEFTTEVAAVTRRYVAALALSAVDYLHAVPMVTPRIEDSPENSCPNLGNPYCSEHEREISLIHSLDNDWKQIEATHRAVCEEPTERCVSAAPIQTSKTVS
jgi:hypothetical protein